MQTFVIVAESLTAQAELAAIGAGAEYEGVALIEKGDDLTCALTLLERLTLPQLHAIQMHHFREVQGRVAKRTAEAAHAKVLAERDHAAHLERTRAVFSADWGPFDAPLPIATSGTYVPPEAEGALAELDDDEEDDTPLEVIDPNPPAAA